MSARSITCRTRWQNRRCDSSKSDIFFSRQYGSNTIFNNFEVMQVLNSVKLLKTRQLKIGIHQPYFLPYIAYFALINAVDKFVLADDLQYERRSWINRNRIKVQGNWQYITIPVKKAPQTTPINKIELASLESFAWTLRRTLEANYGSCPYFHEVQDLVFDSIGHETNLSELNIALIMRICDYLGINTPIYISSKLNYYPSETKEYRIRNICNSLGCTEYVNSIGGTDLYSKDDFSKLNLSLGFIKIHDIVYPQGKNGFIPNLSIIDVLMWNSVEDVRKMLNDHSIL